MIEIRPTQKEIHDSIDRIAMTADGRNLYIFLQRKMMEVRDTPDSSALRDHNGERSFAAKLIGLMARGIAESGERTSSTSSSVAEQPVVLPVAEPRAVGGPRGAGRRITADTRVPGWDPDPSAE
jgi:hypothetical protein